MTKILLLNIPSGPAPTDTLPIAISRVIEGLDPALKCETRFIDIDYFRPSFDELLDSIRQYKPDIIGYSAVLTHAYSYLKQLSVFIRKGYPGAIQVLGGQMSVLSNLIVQRTKIDFCVTGESEPVFSELISKLMEADFKLTDMRQFKDIKGLVFMLDDVPQFTGYADPPKGEVRQMNYGLISNYTRVDRYFPKITGDFFRRVINKHEIDGFFSLFHKENLDKRLVHVSSSKGCVGRCTFCHRFFKGYKTYDPDAVISHIDSVMKEHDIGVIQFYGEDFGLDKIATNRLIGHLKERKLNWIAGGTRVNQVDEATISRWKDAGCVTIGYGIESCSQKMLDVMEKRTTVAANLNALNLTFKHGINTGILLLIGMPGETQETIDETIKNLSTAIPDDMSLPYEIIMNYFQAVPGTPGYEYARRVGLIGPTLDDEERYIENLYNINANDIRHYLNFTDYEKEEVAFWKHYILLELIAAYIRKHGFLKTLKLKNANRYRYAALYMLLPRPVRRTLLKYGIIVLSFGAGAALRVLWLKIFKRQKPFFSLVHESLRAVNKLLVLPVRPDDASTAVLREGR